MIKGPFLVVPGLFFLPRSSFQPYLPLLSGCWLRMVYHRLAGYGGATGFEQSFGVEIHASGNPCVAFVSGGTSAGDNCASAVTSAPLSGSQVSHEVKALNLAPQKETTFQTTF